MPAKEPTPQQLATQFKPGESGNPGGRPAGIKSFSILQVISEALAVDRTRTLAIEAYTAAVTDPKTVLAALELAARLNGEVKVAGDAGSQSIAVVILDKGSPYTPGMFREARKQPVPVEGKRVTS